MSQPAAAVAAAVSAANAANAAAAAQIPSERRVHRRQTLTSLVYVELDEGTGGIINNLSPGGFELRAAVPIMDREFTRIRFLLSDSVEWITTPGRIVWMREANRLAGVAFVNPSPLMQEQLAIYLALVTPPTPGEIAVDHSALLDPELPIAASDAASDSLGSANPPWQVYVSAPAPVAAASAEPALHAATVAAAAAAVKFALAPSSAPATSAAAKPVPVALAFPAPSRLAHATASGNAATPQAKIAAPASTASLIVSAFHLRRALQIAAAVALLVIGWEARGIREAFRSKPEPATAAPVSAPADPQTHFERIASASSSAPRASYNSSNPASSGAITPGSHPIEPPPPAVAASSGQPIAPYAAQDEAKAAITAALSNTPFTAPATPAADLALPPAAIASEPAPSSAPSSAPAPTSGPASALSSPSSISSTSPISSPSTPLSGSSSTLSAASTFPASAASFTSKPSKSSRFAGPLETRESLTLIRDGHLVYMPSAAAQIARAQGATQVTVRAVISPDGRVASAEAVTGPKPLAAVALDSVRGWRFEVLRPNGRAMASVCDVTVAVLK